MDIDALIGPIIEFSSTGIGKAITDALRFIYELLYPANAEAAAPFEIL